MWMKTAYSTSTLAQKRKKRFNPSSTTNNSAVCLHKKGSLIKFECVGVCERACVWVIAFVWWTMLWCNPHETEAVHADAASYRRKKRRGKRGKTQRSRLECGLCGAHLSWQTAPQCLLFDIRLVLGRLVDVTGHSKTWTLSQKSIPGWVCLPGMLELFLGKTWGGEGEMVRDGTQHGWTFRLITICVDRQWASPWDTISYSLAPCQASLTNTLAPCLPTHISHAKGLWMIAVGHLRALFSLTHVSWIFQVPPFFSPFLFCALLQLALMEGIRETGLGEEIA